MDYSRVLVNIPQGRAIAQQYEAAPSFDPESVVFWKHFAEQSVRQFDAMTAPESKGGLGIHVESTPQDPYKRVRDMIADIRDNGRLRVLSSASTGGHPVLTDDENDMFRAVHDAFGHAATGRGFGPHGEEAAFRSHLAMYTPDARPAMTSETRGQNSTVNFGGPEGMGLGAGNFAEQKIARIPLAERITPVGRRGAFLIAAKVANAEQLRAFPPQLIVPQ